jgi:hypothetical protein
MSKRRFIATALAAILLPGVLAGISAGYAELQKHSSSFLINWLLLVSPQLVLLLLAVATPKLRDTWVQTTLIVLTVLVVIFEIVVFWFSDANGPMLLGLYFPLSFVVLAISLIFRMVPAANDRSEL